MAAIMPDGRGGSPCARRVERRVVAIVETGARRAALTRANAAPVNRRGGVIRGLFAGATPLRSAVEVRGHHDEDH